MTAAINVEEVLSKLTNDEKVSLLAGQLLLIFTTQNSLPSLSHTNNK